MLESRAISTTKNTRRKTESVVIFYEAIKLLQRRRVNIQGYKVAVADIHRNVTISTEIVFAQDYYFLSPMVQGGSP